MLDITMVNNLRTTIKFVQVNEYTRIAQNLVFGRFTKILPSNTLNQKYLQLLENAVMKDYGQDGGAVRFEDQVIGQQTYTNHVFKTGWEESEFKFRDLDQSGTVGGEGINLLSQWTRNATARAAYQPQFLAISALRNGESTSMTLDNQRHVLKCYDSKALFATDHPYNFKRASLGTFSNLLSGAPTSTVPGFLPLAGPFKKNASTGEWEYDATASVSPEDAFNNLWEMVTYIASVKMADGVTPRYLNPSGIICGKKLQKNVTLITKASFIAAQQGATDIKGTITTLGLSEPIILNELSGLATTEEYDWYLVCEENVAASEIGCINVGLNEPFRVQLFTSSSGSNGVNLELAISNKVVAVGQMRAFVGVGQPQFIFKSKAPR